MPPFEISATKIDKYLNCSESYRRKYVEKDAEFSNPSLLTGNLFHEMAMKGNLEKMNRRYPTEEFLRSIIEEKFERDKKKAFFPGTEEKEIERAKEHAIALIPVFLENNKDIEPVMVETFQKIELTENFTLVLKIDVLDKNGVIHDYKVSSKRKSQGDVDKNTGLTFYALAYREMFGMAPAGLEFQNYIVRTTEKREELKTDFQTLKTDRTIIDIDILLAKCEAIIEAIDKKVFLPASPSSYVCSKDFCSYFRDCRYVNQQRFLEKIQEVF